MGDAFRHRLLRSMLFVPADSERKLAKASSAGADAVDPRPRGLGTTGTQSGCTWLGEGIFAQWSRSGSPVWVRVNDLDSGNLLKDLHAVVHPKLSRE